MEIYHSFGPNYCEVVSAWFCELRKYLGVSTQRKFVTLYFNRNKVWFVMQAYNCLLLLVTVFLCCCSFRDFFFFSSEFLHICGLFVG